MTRQPRFTPTGLLALRRREVAAYDAWLTLRQMGADPQPCPIDTGHAHGPGRRCRVCPDETMHLHGVYCAAHTFSNLAGR